MTDEFPAATTTAPSLASYHKIENIRGAPREHCAQKKPLIPTTTADGDCLTALNSVALRLSKLLSTISGPLLLARRESAYLRAVFVLGFFVERHRPPL
jgi:hypothetical protein